MDKIRIVIDCDGVILNSDLCMAWEYNSRMFEHPEFVEADGNDIYYYDATMQLPLYSKKDIMNIFESDFFWENVTIKDDCIKSIKKLCDDDRFDVCIWSYGSNVNAYKKRKFLYKHLGFVDDIIISNGRVVKKQEVCDGAILIDDLDKNLTNDKAFNICFADKGEKDFNKHFEGIKVNSWNDCMDTIEFIWETTRFI